MTPSHEDPPADSGEYLVLSRGQWDADATPEAIADTFARFGCQRMIHGHTHRPATHQHLINGRLCTRVVLGDWHQHGSVLAVDADGMALIQLQPQR